MNKGFYVDNYGNICHSSINLNDTILGYDDNGDVICHFRTLGSKNGYIKGKLVDASRVAKGKLDAAGNYIYDTAKTIGEGIRDKVRTTSSAIRNRNRNKTLEKEWEESLPMEYDTIKRNGKKFKVNGRRSTDSLKSSKVKSYVPGSWNDPHASDLEKVKYARKQAYNTAKPYMQKAGKLIGSFVADQIKKRVKKR